MHLVHNEGKSVVAKRFYRTLINKIYKYMTSDLRNVYIDNYNNKCYRTIKLKPANVKPTSYIDFIVKNNDKDPKFKVGDHVGY